MAERSRLNLKSRNWDWSWTTRSRKKRSSRSCTNLLSRQVWVNQAKMVLIRAILCKNMVQRRTQESLQQKERGKTSEEMLNHITLWFQQDNQVRSHHPMSLQHRTRNFLQLSRSPKQKTSESRLVDSMEAHASGLHHIATPANVLAPDKAKDKDRWTHTNRCFSRAPRQWEAKSIKAVRQQFQKSKPNSNKELSPTINIIKWWTLGVWEDLANTKRISRHHKEHKIWIQLKRWAVQERAWLVIALSSQ